MEAHDDVCRLDRFGSVTRALPHQMQESATTSLCEFEQQQQQRDVPQSTARIASRAFGSGLSVDVASRKSFPAISGARRATFAVGNIRVMCNGLCASRRFHVDVDDLRCRLGCADQLDSL